MITLVLAMVWHRFGQAVTLALLSLFAVAAAVAAPAYLRAADRAVAAGQVATASAAERSIVASGQENAQTGPVDGIGLRFADVGTALGQLPGFDYIYAAEYNTIGIEPDNRFATRLVYRQDFCAHLTMLTGRCPAGEGEVVLGEQTARRLSLVAGDRITLSYAEFSENPATPIYERKGFPKPLVLIGTYRVPEPGAVYWGTHGYFSAAPGDRPGEPAFVSSATMSAMNHGLTDMTMDGTATPAALAVDNLPALRTGLETLRQNATKIGTGLNLNTSLPDLLDRIDAGRQAAHLLVPVLAVPLVLLACLSIFLAVGYGTEGRRPELAVVALRGARWGQRWWLATGENLVAILIGAIAGCVGGQLLVNAVAAARFPGVGADAGLASLRFAPVAALAALAAALLAERRQLVSPVAALLRRAPAVTGGARALAVEAAVLLLAIVAGAQLMVTGGALDGVGTFAAALILLALALLSARALLPAVTRWAARALRRARLGSALAAFQLSRRPGAARLFALLVAAVAVSGYAAAAVDVAARGRAVEAGIGVGADRVVSVAPVHRSRLLAAVRAADPDGTWAMAAVRIPASDAATPDGLGVDSGRLAATSFWPRDAVPPAGVAAALRPREPDPVVVPGQDLAVDLTTAGLDLGAPVNLNVVLSVLDGGGDVVARLGNLRAGSFTFQRRIAACAKGCRLTAFEFTSARGVTNINGTVVVRGLRATNPARDAVPAARLTDLSRWRTSGLGKLAAAPQGLGIDIAAPIGLAEGLLVLPADVPYPLPVATAGVDVAKRMTGFDGRIVDIDRVERLPAVPAAGTHAVLFDLEYADRAAADAVPARGAQVWLSPRAPADALDRLQANGLVVADVTRASEIRERLDRQGPAISLGFYVLAGALAVAFGAGALILAATVDRARRVEDLSALRAQGLGRRSMRRATLWTYPVLVLIAGLTGLVIAAVGWLLTGWALPLAGINPPELPMPGWPRLWVVPATGFVVMVVLAGVAYLAGRRTLKEIP